MVTEMRTRETPSITIIATTTDCTELQVRLVIKTPSETMRAPRTLTVLLPLLAVTIPAIGAETTQVPVIRLEVMLKVSFSLVDDPPRSRNNIDYMTQDNNTHTSLYI